MFIYIIGNTGSQQKIGFAKNPERRLKALQTGNAQKLFLHYTIEVPEEKVKILEKKIHHEISHKRIKGEWFNINPAEAKLILDHAVIRWLDDNLLY
ncbi:MAG: GIY-YIG nuclease family protein [archaeon]